MKAFLVEISILVVVAIALLCLVGMVVHTVGPTLHKVGVIIDKKIDDAYQEAVKK